MSNIRRYRQLNFPTKHARLARCAVYVRFMCGFGAVYVRSMCGVCAVFVRCLCGLCAALVRSMCGVCAVFVLFWCDFGAVFVLFWCDFGAGFVLFWCGLCAILVRCMCGISDKPTKVAQTPRKYRKKESAGGLINKKQFTSPHLAVSWKSEYHINKFMIRVLFPYGLGSISSMRFCSKRSQFNSNFPRERYYSSDWS